MKSKILFFSLMLFALAERAASLKVLSFNVKGLPPAAADGFNQERFAEIGRLLAARLADGTAPDVVLLQEVFTKEAVGLISASGYPYFAQGPTRNGIDDNGDAFQKSFSSGIYILSRYPIQESGQMSYGRKVCGTFDCFANKGLMYVKIKVPGTDSTLTVFNTHMQAEEDYDAVRVRQAQVLRAFVQRHLNPGEIFLFGGDFNSHPGRESFGVLKDILGAGTAGEFCLSPQNNCRVETPDPALIVDQSVDHLFFKAPLTPVSAVRNFGQMYLDQHLSDHFGYEVEFVINLNKN